MRTNTRIKAFLAFADDGEKDVPSVEELAADLRVSKKVVRTWLNRGSFTERGRRKTSMSTEILDILFVCIALNPKKSHQGVARIFNSIPGNVLLFFFVLDGYDYDFQVISYAYYDNQVSGSAYQSG